MTDLGPGAVVAQRYRLERLLGEGGMGAVWAGVDVATGEHVALKFIKGLAAVSPLHHKRFYREARAAMAVKHPNVVRIHEVVRGDDGAPIMVMDLLVGESLAQRIAREGALPLPTVARLMVQVVSAVGTAHMVGIVHRDLKPDNIFLQRGAAETEVRVLDFGIAKLTATEGDAAQTAGITSTGSLMGTPYYMAPEQVFGEKDLDHRADIWALGVVLYEALAGVRPIDGENVGQLFKKITKGEIAPLSSVAPHLPADVTELVARMLQVERAQRPADLREVLEVLQRHTSLQTLDFGAATLPVRVSDMPSDVPAAFGATAPAAATVSAIESAPTVATDGALARSHATERPSARSRARLAVVFGSAAALVAGGLYFTQMRAAPTSSPESPPAVAVDTTTAAPPPAAASTPVTIESAPRPSAAAVTPSSSAAPENKSPALKPRPSASASVSSAASAAVSAAVPGSVAKPTSVGGIGTAIPF